MDELQATSPAYADIGPTSRTSSVPHPAILKIISELGLRYRPVATADQEDHQTGVLLLARDVAGADPKLLKRAADEWARTERWMPKAVDLLELIKKYKPAGTLNLQALADQGNAKLSEIGRSDCRWVVRNGQVVLEAA